LAVRFPHSAPFNFQNIFDFFTNTKGESMVPRDADENELNLDADDLFFGDEDDPDEDNLNEDDDEDFFDDMED